MEKALLISNLSKMYKSGVHALKGVELEVSHGDFFALLGPNGAGKSTLIGVISSLVSKSAGDVRIYGKDIDIDSAAAKAMIGLVPQEFNFNVFEPVVEIVVNQAGYYGIDRKTASKRAEFYLKQLALWDKRHEMARNLSGGMKRRLMIARALVHRPRLLILDEPTAGVDIEIRHSMWKFLKQLNEQGTTIILTTHYLEEAESLCRNIAIINHGRIIENTSMKALLGKANTETLVLDLRTPLEHLPDMPGHAIRRLDENTIEVETSREKNINGLFIDLAEHGVEVKSMRNKSSRLEQLFLELLEQGKTALQ